MITTIVQFKLPDGTSLEAATELFEKSAPMYRTMNGLVRKYYLFGEDGTAGGAYLWESRQAAEAVYTDEWREMVTERYGAAPEVRYFETPVIVDNTLGEISGGQAA